jgi:hypothetical protein
MANMKIEVCCGMLSLVSEDLSIKERREKKVCPSDDCGELLNSKHILGCGVQAEAFYDCARK